MAQVAEKFDSAQAVIDHAVVSKAEWLKARRALLEEEKALTHARDALARKRRELPWVKLEKEYVFESPEGPKPLAELFGNRSQLFVYHFMLSPNNSHICPGCSFIADHVDAARQHFEHGDLAFTAISRAKIGRIEEVKKRMGWKFSWVSSFSNSFNFDFNVSFTPEQLKNEVDYNFGKLKTRGEEQPGASVFYKDETGAIFHTYSGYARSLEVLLGAFNFLDFAPKGRNETSTMSWVKLHDEYAGAAKAQCCH